jgi:HTH-type transcriptional regulator / antitoxin HipB
LRNLCGIFDKTGLCAQSRKVLCDKPDIDDLLYLAHNLKMNDVARDPKQIGNTIRRTRKLRGWSQADLGARARLRQESISLIENGNPAVRIENLLAVLAALGLEFQIAPRSKGWDLESNL